MEWGDTLVDRSAVKFVKYLSIGQDCGARVVDRG
jgi:hypothetical protein